MQDKLNNMTVLIVDDEDLMRRSIRIKLSKEGYECLEASCASEALEQLASNKIDLAILDIKMPGLSGLDLLPRLRSEYPDTAVVMSTAVVDAQTIVQCMKAGAHDYLPKPFEFEEMLISVGNALVKNTVEKELKNFMDEMVVDDDGQGGQVRKLSLASFESMVNALDSRDMYTAGHSRRVARISGFIGLELALDGSSMDDLHWGALLHDIGKIAVDHGIQNKPDKLTGEEYRHILFHSQIGPAIVERVANKNIQDIIRYHHDRYDGAVRGQAKAGEEIPLGARIVAVADTYDAITSERPFRDALTTEKAYEEITRCSGTQFDPRVVGAFASTFNDQAFHSCIMR